MKTVRLEVNLPDGYEDFTIKSVSIMKITDEIEYKRLPVKIVENTDREIIEKCHVFLDEKYQIFVPSWQLDDYLKETK
jgi:hypothetical protein